MKERAKKFKKILEFTKSKGYSKESAEILFKLWNYIILPNEEDKLVSSLASFDEFMAGLKEADEIFTELNFKEVEKIRYFFILTGKKEKNITTLFLLYQYSKYLQTILINWLK